MKQPDHFSIDFEGGQSVNLPINLLQRSIFPVVLLRGGRMQSLGTAFAISNHGLCMTAGHVLSGVPLRPDADSRDRTIDGQLGILYISDDIPPSHAGDLLGGFMPIAKAYLLDSTDVAVMHVALPVEVETGEFIQFPLNRLRLPIPEPNARLIAFGYEKGVWTCDNDGGHTLSQTFSGSTGFMRMSHPAGRDSVMLPMPCFQTSLPLHSGMSGGPIITEDGFVVGVVSTGFETIGENEAISYASPIAPSMFLTINALDEHGNEALKLLWDFAEGGAIIVDKAEAVVARQGGQLSIEVSGVKYEGQLQDSELDTV